MLLKIIHLSQVISMKKKNLLDKNNALRLALFEKVQMHLYMARQIISGDVMRLRKGLYFY